jgi:hypothetical protein
MTDEKPAKVVFHADAIARFNELAQELFSCVGSFGQAAPPPAAPHEIHPVIEIPASDIIEEIKVVRSAVNGLGEETGRYWESKGLLVGWEGDNFERIKKLARGFEKQSAIKGQISEEFLVDEVFNWLRGTLERERSDALCDHIAEQCSQAIEEQEIWIPVHGTYARDDFQLGGVEFRTVSKAMMEEWFARIPPEQRKDPGALYAIHRERSRMQGVIAARIRVKAELQKARETAHVAANEAIGLLRFLSHVNWTSKIVSYCAPLGRENTALAVELFVKNGAIANSRKTAIDQGHPSWDVDHARAMSPGVFESLQELAADRKKTAFRRDLYDALQLHSRNSVAASVSHKMVFVIASIESLLLRDSNEPIQKNLAERMAFIVGKTLDERKAIVTNVEEFYRIRSGLIHHGQEATVQDIQVIDKFFFYVWWTFRHLIAELDRYETKDQLLRHLEDLKLS